MFIFIMKIFIRDLIMLKEINYGIFVYFYLFCF